MIYRLLLSSMAIFTLATCQNQNTANSAASSESTEVTTNTSTSTTPHKEMVYLKEGQNIYLEEYKMNVTFKRMVEDSRCPKEVQCVWAGNATAEVELMGVATRPRLLKLSTSTDAQKGYFTKQNLYGMSISLLEISPETTSAKGFKALQGSYKIGLKIETETDQNSRPEKGGVTTK